jgi:hypothetical protein
MTNSHASSGVPSLGSKSLSMGLHNKYFAYAAAALAGLVICLVITIATGRREAWDTPVYFVVGIPLMCMAIFAISYLFPIRAWRWTFSMAVGQSLAIASGGGDLSLWPLSIIAIMIVSVPQFVAGLVASKLAKRKVGA